MNPGSRALPCAKLAAPASRNSLTSRSCGVLCARSTRPLAGLELARLQRLPVSRQCRLLAVSRASVYRRPAEISEGDCTIVTLIDRQYLARPYYGSRRMAAWLATQGHVVNRKRVRRLMRLAG